MKQREHVGIWPQTRGTMGNRARNRGKTWEHGLKHVGTWQETDGTRGNIACGVQEGEHVAKCLPLLPLASSFSGHVPTCFLCFRLCSHVFLSLNSTTCSPCFTPCSNVFFLFQAMFPPVSRVSCHVTTYLSCHGPTCSERITARGRSGYRFLVFLSFSISFLCSGFTCFICFRPCSYEHGME